MRKKVFSIIIILVLGLGTAVVSINVINSKNVELLKQESKNNFASDQVSENERLLINFVQNKLTNENYGVKTNYLNNVSENEITKGDAVLSESQGLIMLYYVTRGDKECFDNTYSYVKQNMVLDNKLISWRVDKNQKSDITATIDDLRIIRALLYASVKWDNADYRKQALSYSKALKKQLQKDNLLLDYNGDSKNNNQVTLSYLDLETFKMLSFFDRDYKKIYQKSLELIDSGYIGDTIPLYRKSYSIDTESFDNSNIDTLLSVITIKNRVEAGIDSSNSLSYLKEKFKKDGALYAEYSLESGEPSSNIESTSIYSYLLQAASITDDNELVTLCIDKIKKYQVMENNSQIFGGIGNAKTLELYSFDNLNALNAYERK